jgi:hypothetical protein
LIRRGSPDGKTAFTLEMGSDAFFDRVRVLKPRELDGEAFFQLTHHPAGDLAEGDHRADVRPQGGRHRDAGARQ